MSNRVGILLALAAIAGSVTLVDFANSTGEAKENKIPEQVRVILEQAEEFELLSLNPKAYRKPGELIKDPFHGFEMLGKTIVKDVEMRDSLITAFKKGVEENDGNFAFCFAPRHGIRAIHDGKTAEFLICFECMQVESFLDGKLAGKFLITPSPAPVFNKVLTDAQVPLPAPPEEKK